MLRVDPRPGGHHHAHRRKFLLNHQIGRQCGAEHHPLNVMGIDALDNGFECFDDGLEQVFVVGGNLGLVDGAVFAE